MADEDDDIGLDEWVSDENDDYRETERWAMENLATKDRSDAAEIVQHPIREEVERDDGEAQIVQTMGLSVSPATPSGVVTVQNTAVDSPLSERFVAFDVALIDDVIDALEDVKDEYSGDETFVCPCCATEYSSPDELDEDGYGLVCPECEYLL